MPIFPAVALLTARALETLKKFSIRHFAPYHFARLAIALTIVVTLFTQLRFVSAFNPAAFILGYRDRAAYLSHVLDNLYPSSPYYYSAMRIIEQQLSPDAQVGLLWPEGRVYYMPRSYAADPFPRGSSPQEMWDISQELSLTHLLVGRSVLEFELELGAGAAEESEKIAAYVDRLDAFLSEHGSLVHDEHGAYQLYSLVGSRS